MGGMENRNAMLPKETQQHKCQFITAEADSISPTLICRNTEVGITSVFIQVASANIRIGPNSPSERAQASVAATSKPRRASGRVTFQKARLRVQPRVSASNSSSTQAPGAVLDSINRLSPTTSGGSTMGTSSRASTRNLPRKLNRERL